MRNPQIKKVASYFLLLLFITAIIPDVFIHAFAHHEDDVDFYSGSSNIGEHHTHCEGLLDEMPALQLTDAIHFPAAPVSFCKLKIEFPESVQLVFTEFLSLRGPPSLV